MNGRAGTSINWYSWFGAKTIPINGLGGAAIIRVPADRKQLFRAPRRAPGANRGKTIEVGPAPARNARSSARSSTAPLQKRAQIFSVHPGGGAGPASLCGTAQARAAPPAAALLRASRPNHPPDLICTPVLRQKCETRTSVLRARIPSPKNDYFGFRATLGRHLAAIASAGHSEAAPGLGCV